MSIPKFNQKDFVISYYVLRKAIGYLVISVPTFIYTFGYVFENIPLLGSISAYYYSDMRDVFVGSLSAVGVFLLFYRGYDDIDNWTTNIGGGASIGIGLFPTDPGYVAALSNMSICPDHGPLGYHMLAVVTFFAAASYLVIFRFTKSDQPTPSPAKSARNRAYYVTGSVMLISILAIIAIKLSGKTASIFWPETFAIAAFGAAWLVKGQAILKDEPA